MQCICKHSQNAQITHGFATADRGRVFSPHFKFRTMHCRVSFQHLSQALISWGNVDGVDVTGIALYLPAPLAVCVCIYICVYAPLSRQCAPLCACVRSRVCRCLCGCRLTSGAFDLDIAEVWFRSGGKEWGCEDAKAALKTQPIASINRVEVMEREREKPKSTVPVLTALAMQSCCFDMKFRFFSFMLFPCSHTAVEMHCLHVATAPTICCKHIGLRCSHPITTPRKPASLHGVTYSLL